MRVIIMCSRLDTMYRKRRRIFESFAKAGHKILVLSIESHPGTEEELRRQGIDVRVLRGSRNGISIWSDMTLFFRIAWAITRFRPDRVVSFTIKPNVYGGLAARILARSIAFVPVVTGLGYGFQKGSGALRSVLRLLVIALHRMAFSRARKVVFQNEANRSIFIDNRIVRLDRTCMVPGSGVVIPDASRISDGSSRRFVTVARLLGEKGLRELRAAVVVLKKQEPNFHVELYGPLETSPDALNRSEVDTWKRENSLVWKGYCGDVGALLSDTYCFVLPSYHEGMSTAVAEAMSHGVPIVGTDIPGIRELVEGNGFLVSPRNVEALAAALASMLSLSRSEWLAMSRRSRELALQRCDREVLMDQLYHEVSNA